MVPHFPMLNAGLPILRPLVVAEAIRLTYSAVPPLLRLLGGVASRWARTSTGGLFYLDSGEPRATSPLAPQPLPPLMLLHGLHTTSACWGPLVLELAHTRRVLVPDLLDYDFGFSRSSDEAAERRATFEQHVSSVGDLIAALGVKVELVGHSYGGGVALGLARRRPLLLSRLVLLCPFAAGLHDFGNELTNEMGFSRALTSTAPITKRVARLAGGFFLNAQDLDVGFAAPHYARGAAPPPPLQTPTLLIWGTQDALVKALPPAQLAERFGAQLEGWWVEGAQHWITIDSVLAISRLLSGMVGELAVIIPIANLGLVPGLQAELPSFQAAVNAFTIWGRGGPHIEMTDYTDFMLKWWRTNAGSFPTWAIAARIVFAMSASSAEAERIFSLLKAMFGADQQSARTTFRTRSC